MTAWLSQQDKAVLSFLARDSAHAFLASSETGEILWANTAFCERLKFTTQEIVGKAWSELASTSSDLTADMTMAEEVRVGRIQRYRMRMGYDDKDGIPHPVVIMVRRWPIGVDPLKFFLVDVDFIDESTSLGTRIDQLTDTTTELTAMLVSHLSKPSVYDDVKNGLSYSFEKHPIKSWAVVFLVGMFVFAITFGFHDSLKLFAPLIRVDQ